MQAGLTALLRSVSAYVASLSLCAAAWAADQRYIVNVGAASGLKVQQVIQQLTLATGYPVTHARQMVQPGSWAVTLDAPDFAHDDLLVAIRRLPSVYKAHTDFILKPVQAATVRPDDPAYATLQAPYMDSAGYASLRMPSVWALARGSASVVVAVLDSGVLYAHPELKGRLLQGYDFVSSVSAPAGPNAQAIPGASDDGDARDADASDPGDAGPVGSCSSFNAPQSTFHGTAVSSVIAANTGNGSGMAGINGAVRILPLRISGQCGSASSSDILDAMYWAVGDKVTGLPVNPTPARVLNLSFAGGLAFTSCEGTLFADAIARVRQAGAVFVAAAGNSGTALEFPASCTGAVAVGAVAVGAVSPDGRKVGYSAYSGTGGRSAVFMAPSDAGGSYVVASNRQLPDGRPDPTGHFVRQEAGTSFSTPVVSGLIALLLQVRPDWTADQAVSSLKATAKAFPASNPVQQCPPPAAATPSTGVIDNPCYCNTVRCGDGIVNPLGAVTQARSGRPIANVPFATVMTSSNPVSLDATLSSASGSRGLRFSWQQVAGPAFTLSGTENAILQVSPPAGAAGSGRFALQVTDLATGVQHTAETLVLLAGGSAGPTSAGDAGSGSAVGGGTSGTTGGTSSATSPSGSTGTVSASSGSSGGGGAVTAGFFWLLLGVAWLRRAARHDHAVQDVHAA